jgi:hypothetical protein
MIEASMYFSLRLLTLLVHGTTLSRKDGTLMAFNNVGPLTQLTEGGDAWWWYTIGGDSGTQMATADIKIPNAGAVHLADNQRKELDNNGQATYFVHITNQGPGTAWHNLQGGGMA